MFPTGLSMLWEGTDPQVALQMRLGFSALLANWRPTPARVRRTFLEGYQSVRSLTPLAHEWLQALALWYGIRPFQPVTTQPDGQTRCEALRLCDR